MEENDKNSLKMQRMMKIKAKSNLWAICFSETTLIRSAKTIK